MSSNQYVQSLVIKCGIALMWIVGIPLAFIAIISLFGAMIDGIAQHDEQHDLCLKHATNGYEIRECH